MKHKLISRVSDPQHDFVNASDEFPAFVGGFGSGKTDAGIRRTMRLKFAYPRQDVAYYLPTYDLVRRIGYPRFTGLLHAANIKHKLNKAEHVIEIAGKGQIIFRTMDNPERIVGYEVSDSIVDELDTLKRDDAEHVWRQVMARNRQKKPDGMLNTIGVATTPEGFKFVYDRWQKEPTAGYRLIRASTYSNERNLPAGYIDSLKRSYPANLVNAYIHGQFVNLNSGAVYPDFDRETHNTFEKELPGEDLHIGQDFNVYNCTSAVCVIRHGKPIVVGELTKVRDTPDVVKTIKEKYPGHRIFIYPDASGNSNKTVNASESDISILKSAGFEVRVNPSNPLVKERVMAVNRLIQDGEGHCTLTVNTLRAPTVTECLEQQVYDQNGQPDKKDGKDHANDALGYVLAWHWPIVKPESTQSVRIPHMRR